MKPPSDLMRNPVGLRDLQRDQDRFFLERSSVSRALFPGTFDLGVRARGGWRFLDAQVALMNGDPLGDHRSRFRIPTAPRTSSAGWVYATRVACLRRRLFGADRDRVSPGTPETKDVLVWRDQNEDGHRATRRESRSSRLGGDGSRNFHRFALGADARWPQSLPGWARSTLRRGGVGQPTSIVRLVPATRRHRP